MFRKQQTNTFISLIVLAIINLLFIVKYVSRVGWLAALVLGVAYTVFCTLAPFWVGKVRRRLLARRNTLLLIALFILASCAGFWLIKAETLHVDRWSVIKSFLDNLFAGKYPYDAISFMGNSPGPFPFYYVIALPFYLVNEIGLLTLAAVVVFCAFLNKRTADNSVFFMQIILLIASPAMAWEIIARSTIFFNFSMVVLYAFWLEERVVSKNPKHTLLPGIVGGFVLSTRAIAAIPIICYLSYSFLRKKDVSGFLSICLAIGAGFCVTFAPLLFWGWDSFVRQNPVVLQASFVPAGLTVFFLLASFSGGLFLRNFSSWLHFCGVLVFLIIAVSFILCLFDVGWNRALFHHEFDISYFIFCIPLLIASLKNQTVSQYQGKESNIISAS
jgi:hypothetical protein